MKHFYITTAIDYANGEPHLGHAYEKVLTDVIARIKRLSGNNVHFLTGLDEHGQKVQKSAKNQGVAPQKFCDNVAELFKNMLKQLEITHNDYIRTTEPRHKTVVHEVLKKLYNKGEIYKADYIGYYSTKEEQFLQEKDKIEGKWPKQFGEVVEISESNYFFQLSQYQDWLINYIKKNEDFIFPKFRAKQVLEFLKEPLNDLCISRPKERLSWGIPLPFDESYVSYVWLDALLNYISAIGYGTEKFNQYWPVDYHVIGKDILIPPHAIYWPIILKACDIDLPKTLIVHGWWLNSGEKMSKSFGNIVNPLKLIEKFGEDPFRYFLMREMNIGQDSEFSIELFLSRYNSDLANDLGNLLNRVLNMTARYCEGKLPPELIEEEPEKGLKALWENNSKKTIELYEKLQFHKALEQICAFIRGINRYAESRAPWKLAKSKKIKDRQLVETSLALMAEGLRLSATLLTPVMPTVSEKIHQLLRLDSVTEWQELLEWSNELEGNSLGEKCILFPKYELEEITN